MKIRYWLIGYTGLMLLLFVFGLSSFREQSATKRDMVYYNEQRMMIEDELIQGKAVADIEARFDCDILLRTDEKYKIHLQEAVQKESLIVDYMRGNELIGKIIWNKAEEYYTELQQDLFKKVIIVFVAFVMSGYLLLGIIYVRMIRPLSYIYFRS